MKIFSKYAYMGAIALVGAVGFTACSSDDDLTAQDPVTGEVVKTQFAISIPGATQTRMGQDIVQSTGNPFRGMKNVRLVPFDLASTPTGKSNPLTGTETTRYNTIALGDISNLTENSNSKVYTDVDIPLGTDAFLFYGEALPGGDKTDAVNGALVPSFVATGLPVGTTVDKVSFSLKGILGNQDATSSQNALIAILNGLVKLSGWSTATGELKTTYYDNLLKMTAGSANNILLAIQDLYNAMKSDRVTDENGLKASICGKIEENFTPSDASPYTLDYKNDAIDEFPNDLGLPDGAVQVKWNVDDNTFKYVTSVDYDSDAQNTFNVAALDKYVFPSSLYYWLNTNIKTSTKEESGNYGTNDWSTIITSCYNEGYEVTTSTQSVALENPINYAVARLDVYAKFANGDILDNTKPTAQPVRLPAAGFTLNGVLIGGQKAVNWNFTTNTAAGEYTIYDCKVPSTSAGVTTTDGLKNSTLALETQEAVGDKVNFALEFVNNSEQAFTGADGIVPVGGKFYLVGTLTSTDANKKVFEQDHITKANVTIQSLKSAYNCIPDLRSPKLELGLSVDLEWKEGLVDNVVIE